MGRSKLPIERKVVAHTIRLAPEVSDVVCRYALQHDISVYALLGDIVTRVFAKRVYGSSWVGVYHRVAVRSSGPLVVAARWSSGVSGASSTQ